MTFINFIAILMLLLPIIGYGKYIQNSTYQLQENRTIKVDKKWCLFLLLTAFLIRVVCAMLYRGHNSDMNCFLAWSNRVVEVGFSNFYSTEIFTDYPPGYMYILYVIGTIRKWFHLDNNHVISIILTKMPAILCDLAIGWLIFKIAVKRMPKMSAIICTCIYLFNPVVILNSSIWGQVDSVFTLTIVAMCYFIIEKKLPYAYLAFAIGILIKPQTLICTPILMFGIIDQVFLDGFEQKKFWKQLGFGLGAIAIMFCLALPFGLDKVISQYIDTLGSYPYATINGYNIWAMFGLNWSSQENVFLFFTYKQWGTFFIFMIVAVATFMSFRSKKDVSKYFYIGAFIVISMFTLSVRMHERYMFPALILLLLAFLYRPKKEIYILYILFSIANFYNTAHVLKFYDPTNFNRKAMIPILIATGTVIAFVYLVYCGVRYYIIGKDTATVDGSISLGKEERLVNWSEKENEVMIEASDKKIPKWTKWDFIILMILIVIYSGFALYDLGRMDAPESGWSSSQVNDQILLDLGESQEISSVSYFLGNYERRTFLVEVAEDLNGPWVTAMESLEMDKVFKWGNTELNTFGRYIRFTTLKDKSVIFEMSLLDSNKNTIEPVNKQDYSALFDEQELRPERATFREGTYFDEIYHARTAYEFIHGLHTYEWTHPPLGKIIMSLGIRMFGMNPFGWRIIGTFLGILMVPIMYAFGKRFFKLTWMATFLTILFTFDFMHFAQTRIATIDVFVTFFIILMYYFMYQYTQMSFYDTKLTKTWIPLGLCGISMGLGIASKWTGIYAGAGLAIIFFWHLYKRFREYQYALKHTKGETNGIKHSYIVHHFREYTIKTILFCMVFFVVIPLIIYILSYIPFEDSRGTGLIETIIHNQEAMFNYHKGVTSEHPYSSTWYQWPIMYRPIWYYSGHINDTISEGISAFGNPLVWWTGIPAFCYLVYLMWKQKDKKAGFLVIGYLAQYVPWFFVTRVIFIYHYFPSVPFVAMMVAYSVYKLVKKWPKLRIGVWVYAIAAIGLFLLFYPVLSGQPIDKNFVFQFLRWFDSWVLVT